MDAEQVGEREDRRGLALRVGVHGVWSEVRGVLEQALQDGDRLPHPARNEVAEQRHVAVGRVMVGDPARPPVADVGRSQEVLLGEIVLGSVGRRASAVAPDLGQREGVVPIEDVSGRRRECLRGDVAPVDEREHVGCDNARRCRAACAGPRLQP